MTQVLGSKGLGTSRSNFKVKGLGFDALGFQILGPGLGLFFFMSVPCLGS